MLFDHADVECPRCGNKSFAECVGLSGSADPSYGVNLKWHCVNCGGFKSFLRVDYERYSSLCEECDRPEYRHLHNVDEFGDSRVATWYECKGCGREIKVVYRYDSHEIIAQPA